MFGKKKSRIFSKKTVFSSEWRNETMKLCVLYDRECIECGECDRCDLDPNKICDNCMKCVNGDDEYRSILVDRIIMPEEAEKKPAQ